MNITVLQEFFHSWIFYIFRSLFKGKTCKNWFIEIMITPTGIDAIVGFYFFQNFFHFCRFHNGIIFIIKNISGNTYEIRILFVDFSNNLFGMNNTCIIAEMSVCQENYFHGIHIWNLFVYSYLVGGHCNFFCMKNPIQAE